MSDVASQSGRRDSEVGSDPPLFLSGRNFVTVSRAESETSGQNRTMSSAVADGAQLTSVGQDSMGTMSTVHVDLTRSEETDHHMEDSNHNRNRDHHAASGSSHHVSPPVTDLPDDEEIHETVKYVKQHQAVIEQEGKQIEWLELTGRQLHDMVNDVDGSCKIEYFNANYFTTEAQKVWQDRQAGDLSPERSSRVRLLGSVNSSILNARSTSPMKMLRPTSSTPSVMATHPLIHRKAQQNEERRAAFRAAALERRSSSGVDSGTESAASIYLPQKHLFACPPLTATKATAHTQVVVPPPSAGKKETPAEDEQPNGANEAPSDEAAPASAQTQPPAKDEVDSKPAATKSLSALLQEQRTLLANMKEHDERVYQPLLTSYFKYEGHVQEKLSRILNMALEPTPSSPPAQ